MNINNSKIKNECIGQLLLFDSILSKKFEKIFFQLKKWIFCTTIFLSNFKIAAYKNFIKNKIKLTEIILLIT